jgi:hypothetical protein
MMGDLVGAEEEDVVCAWRIACLGDGFLVLQQEAIS